MTGTRHDTPETISRAMVHNYALTTIAVGVLLAILYWARVVFITTTIAVILALILEPFVSLLTRLRFPRPVATLLVGVIAGLFLYLAALAAWSQLSGIAVDAPAMQQRLSEIVTDVSDRIRAVEDSTAHLLTPAKKAEPAPPVVASPPASASRKNRREALPALLPPVLTPVLPGAIPEVRIHADSNPIADYIYARLGTVYEFLLMSSFVPFLVFFMLSWRDHIYRSFLRFFDGPDRLAAARSLEGVAEMARAFVVGNFLIGLLLSAISFAAFAFLRLPYSFLIGTLSGFLSLVPYAGMALALFPPLLAALAGGQPSSGILLTIAIVLGLHFTAMNVLYPKLVGARVHLNPLVVTFSLMFWGFIWDAAGLVLAIPMTAGIKAVCDNVAGLRPFGRFLGD